MTFRYGTLACSLVAISLAGTEAFADVNGKAGRTIVSDPQPLALSSSGPVASVNANGTLARGKGIATSSRITTGQYTVETTRDIHNCFYIATIGVPGAGTAGTGEIQTALMTGTVDTVFVATTSSTGTPVDRAFFLHVVCK